MALKPFYIFITCFEGFNSFPDPPYFDKRPLFRPNGILAFFYTVAEKALGSSNLKKRVVDN